MWQSFSPITNLKVNYSYVRGEFKDMWERKGEVTQRISLAQQKEYILQSSNSTWKYFK